MCECACLQHRFEFGFPQIRVVSWLLVISSVTAISGALITAPQAQLTSEQSIVNSLTNKLLT